MKLTATKSVTAQDVRPADMIERDDGVFLVDSITIDAGGLAIATYPSSRQQGKRIVHRYSPNDPIKLVASPEAIDAMADQIASSVEHANVGKGFRDDNDHLWLELADSWRVQLT
jgi:hypothetical protein